MDVQEGLALVHPIAPVLPLLPHSPELSTFSLAAQVLANHRSQAGADGVFSRFQRNQQPWQTGRLTLVGEIVFLGAGGFKWDWPKCFCTNG